MMLCWRLRRSRPQSRALSIALQEVIDAEDKTPRMPQGRPAAPGEFDRRSDDLSSPIAALIPDCNHRMK
jgi:hypothetical protein